MSWTTFMRSLVVTAAGSAAAAGATSVGGPIAGSVAEKAASAAADTVMSQFLKAEESILSRLDEMNSEMRGRLIGIQQGVDVLLDKDYLAARMHLQEAARLPKQRGEELRAAKSKLFDAWGAANTPIRKYLVAQHMAIAYSMLGEADMVRQWLTTSCQQIRGEVAGQAAWLHSTITPSLTSVPIDSDRNASYAERSLKRFKLEQGAFGFDVFVFGVTKSAAALDVFRNPSLLSPGDYGAWYPESRKNVRWRGYLPRNAELEGWLSGLALLDAEAAGAYKLCESANIPPESLPTYRWQMGAVRIYKGRTYNWGPGVLVRFSPSVAVEFGIWGDPRISPICSPLPKEASRFLCWEPWEEGADYPEDRYVQGEGRTVGGIDGVDRYWGL